MTTTIEKHREQIRRRMQGRKPQAAEPWRFPDVNDFLLRHKVLVFDGTLSNAGWVFMEARRYGIEVFDKGTIRPVTALTGYQETWDKGQQLYRALGAEPLADYARDADSIVVEAPAVKGHRTESSLIAGLMVLLEFEDISMHWTDERYRCPAKAFRSVSATHVSAVLLGDPRVPSAERKKRIRDAVIRLYPAAAGRDWNEHERDALATGAVHLYDEQRRKVP